MQGSKLLNFEPGVNPDFDNSRMTYKIQQGTMLFYLKNILTNW